MISSFVGLHHYLSNFHLCPVEWIGTTWISSLHAFQATKATRYVDMVRIRDAKSCAESKRIGDAIPCHPDWDLVSVDVMYDVVLAKFTQHPDLADKLVGTWPHQLVDGNQHGDRFWGTVDGEGTNWLGFVLMRVRHHLRVLRGLPSYCVHDIIHDLGTRKEQQDSYLTSSDAGLYAVADGMGGHPDGKLASQTAISATLYHSQGSNEPSKIMHGAASAVEKLDPRKRRVDDDNDWPGSTLTFVRISGTSLHVGHIGDSGLWEIFPGNGALTECHGSRWGLGKALGDRERKHETRILDIPKGTSRLLLATDGLVKPAHGPLVKGLYVPGKVPVCTEYPTDYLAKLLATSREKTGDNATGILLEVYRP